MAESKQKKIFKPLKIQVDLDDKLYLKDPNSSELGLQIIQHGIQLIDKIGFEAFTFKKLATKIGATEPSIYRYFTKCSFTCWPGIGIGWTIRLY
jgi:hypothetical protein